VRKKLDNATREGATTKDDLAVGVAKIEETGLVATKLRKADTEKMLPQNPTRGEKENCGWGRGDGIILNDTPLVFNNAKVKHGNATGGGRPHSGMEPGPQKEN